MNTENKYNKPQGNITNSNKTNANNIQKIAQYSNKAIKT